MMATAHFTDGELCVFRARPAEMGQFLEAVRLAGGGVPLRVTSGDRTPTDSVRVGGVSGGCHERGMAFDAVPLTSDRGAWIARVTAEVKAGRLQVGELIWYPDDGHVHVTLPECGGRNELLVKRGGESTFTSLVAWLSTGGTLSLVPFLLAFLVLIFLGRSA